MLVKNMESLKLEQLKNKKLKVLIVEKEYNEPFWLIEPTNKSNSELNALNKSSIAFTRFLEKLISKTKPNFVTEELGMRSLKEFNEDNNISQLFNKKNIPFYPTDIEENAKAYLAKQLEEKKQLRDQIVKALDYRFTKKEKNTDSIIEEEYMIAYGQYLQSEFEKQERELNFSVRENWIVMKILEFARDIKSKREIMSIHISSPQHSKGIGKLLEKLNIQVEIIGISKEITVPFQDTTQMKSIENLLQTMQIKVKPTIKNESKELPYLLFFLDSDRIASPFDVCMAYDAGYDAVIPYENVNSKNCIFNYRFSVF